MEAFHKRRVFGATDNILADVRCGDHFMGEEFDTAAPPAISVKLWGMAPFAKVQIVKDGAYVYSVQPNAKERQLHMEGRRRGEGQDQLLLRARRAAGRRTGVGQPHVDHVPVSRKAAIILNTMPQTLSRRQMLRAAGAAPLLAAWNQASAAGRRPNIVVILADDQGWGDLSVHGNTNLSTPNIDSLARDGALFDRFYVCPVCSPTRAEFLTGRYHPRGGVRGVSTGGERLNLDEKTIARDLQGRRLRHRRLRQMAQRHAVPLPSQRPRLRRILRLHLRPLGPVLRPAAGPQRQAGQGKGFITDDLTDHALEFIAAEQERPVLLLPALQHAALAHAGARPLLREVRRHATSSCAPATRSRKTSLITRAALAMCENIDWNVGRVLDKLDELKLADNTIVLYFSDNGPNSWRWNGGMKGRKGSTDEGGVRSPFLIRWPGHIRRRHAHPADRRRHRPAAHAGRPGRHPADRQQQAAGRHQPQAAAARPAPKTGPTA